MDWSREYLKRKQLMKTLQIPTISEATQELGMPLADILFEECNEEMSIELGLEPPLTGVRDELWVSPSDLLDGKLCLKPPFDRKCIQALTHEGILEIGAIIEEKYWNQMRILREEALESLECYMKRMCELEKLRVEEKVRAEEFKRYLHQLEMLTEYYEQKILVIIQEFAKEMRLMLLKAQQDIRDLNLAWRIKLENELKRVLMEITQEFLNKIRAQEEVLVNIFRYQVRMAQLKKRYEIEVEKSKCKEALLQLKHSLECKNLSNIMYILIRERRKCYSEKKYILEHHQRKISELEDKLQDQEQAIEQLINEKNIKIEELAIREKCLVEVLRQFKNFIYYALKESPAQAEYLLNVDDLIELGVKADCLKSRISKTDDYIIKKKEKQQMSAEEFLTSVLYPKEEQQEIVKEEYAGEEDIPIMYLNQKMYVREDFRDNQEKVKFNTQHMLWPKLVEECHKKAEMKEIVKKERREDKDYQIGSKKIPVVCPVHLTKQKEAQQLTNYFIKACPQSQALPQKRILKQPINFQGKTIKDIISTTHSKLTLTLKSKLGCVPDHKKSNVEAGKKSLANYSVTQYISQKKGKGRVALKGPAKKSLLQHRQKKMPVETSKLILHKDSLDVYNEISIWKSNGTKLKDDYDGVISTRKSTVSYASPIMNIIPPMKEIEEKPLVHQRKSNFSKDKPRGIVGDRRNMSHIETPVTPEQFAETPINSVCTSNEKQILI